MIAEINRKKDFLLCVDSDGCAIDSMNEKHIRAFCPELIRVYNLQAHEKLITDFWMKINLFSATRGINRFKGLSATLCMLAENGIETEGWQDMRDFVKSAKVLSNAALEAAIALAPSKGLERALEWSLSVNKAISALGDGKPFSGCKEALEGMHQDMDIAVVSSANGGAVEHEWAVHGLSEHTDIRYGQEAGTKADCIKKLLQSGYAQNHVLMVGDALGDLDAAKQNGVLFYPILVGSEQESWQTLLQEAKLRFLGETYVGEYENQWIGKIKDILK
ncbi:MAG: HAD hydrolase-like protein [Oscillospiraceae bacterium]